MQTTVQSSCIPRELQLQASMLRLRTVSDQIEAGYKILRKYHKTVTVFGSARLQESDKFYQQAQEFGGMLANHHYAVVTGGGPGIMEAANRGAFEAGGDSIGFNIVLPHEQSLNQYTTEELSFNHFAPRKIVMTMMADAYVYFPGGFGSLDELSEILTLIQTGKTQPAPVILIGTEFWHGMDVFFTETMNESFATISPDDEHFYMITDDLDEAMASIEANDTYCGH